MQSIGVTKLFSLVKTCHGNFMNLSLGCLSSQLSVAEKLVGEGRDSHESHGKGITFLSMLEETVVFQLEAYGAASLWKPQGLFGERFQPM